MDKQMYREQAITHRDSLQLHGDEGERAAEMFLKHIAPKPGEIVAPYLSMRSELDTVPLLDDLRRSGVQIALPMMQDGIRVLRFALWRDGEPLAVKRFGIREPVLTSDTEFVTPHYLVVPVLGFDQRGHRLGYGGGYYDATISDLRAHKTGTQVIGYAYSRQAVLFPLPTDPHDENLDCLISENGILRFGT